MYSALEKSCGQHEQQLATHKTSICSEYNTRKAQNAIQVGHALSEHI